MSRRVRHATSVLAVAAIAVIAVVFVRGMAAAARPQGPCAAATNAAYRTAVAAVARHIANGERGGTAVRRALHTIESDRVLAAAVASGDDAAVHAEMLVLLFNHEHIVRIRVLRGARVIDDVGGPLVLAPVRGVLRQDGKAVGSFLMSIQDDMGYRLLLARLAGAHSVITYRGRAVMRDIAVSPRRLAAGGTVGAGAARYLVSSLSVGRFPAGKLRVFVLVREPPKALGRASCNQVRADALAAIARNAYDEALSGQQIVKAVGAISRATSLRTALGAGDYATAEHLVRGLVAAGGFAALRVYSRGHLVAEAGSPRALIAPVSRRLHASGAIFGRATFTAQSAHGYADLAHFLTGAPVLVRSGRRQLAGSFAGPRSLPRSGSVSYGGVDYRVASFAGERFPSGRLRVYLLSPEAS